MTVKDLVSKTVQTAQPQPQGTEGAEALVSQPAEAPVVDYPADTTQAAAEENEAEKGTAVLSMPDAQVRVQFACCTH